METVSSSLTGSGINTDRISAASRQRVPENKTLAVSSRDTEVRSSTFKREVPMPKNAEFVEIDGKKYFLNAPRGTYLNILV